MYAFAFKKKCRCTILHLRRSVDVLFCREASDIVILKQVGLQKYKAQHVNFYEFDRKFLFQKFRVCRDIFFPNFVPNSTITSYHPL